MGRGGKSSRVGGVMFCGCFSMNPKSGILLPHFPLSWADVLSHVTDSYSEEVKEGFRGGAIKTLGMETTECLPLLWNIIEYWTFFFFKHTFSPLTSQCSRRPAVKILAWFPSPAALRWATRARREFWNASLDLLSPAATQSTRSWKTTTTSEPQVGAVPAG